MNPIKKNTSGEDNHVNPIKKTASKKIAPTTATAQAPSQGPATATANSTAEQPAPAPQATQAPTPTATPATPVTQVTSVSGRNRGNTKETLQTSLVALIAGLQANFAADYVFDLPTGPVTTSELLATFTQYIPAAETTKAQYLSWRTAVAAEHAIEKVVTSTRSLVKGALLNRYGKQSPQVLQFGFAPYKVPVKSAAAKTVGAAKASATRKASGAGKKQKLTVTTTATGVTITPADAPVASSAPAAASKPTAS